MNEKAQAHPYKQYIRNTSESNPFKLVEKCRELWVDTSSSGKESPKKNGSKGICHSPTNPKAYK